MVSEYKKKFRIVSLGCRTNQYESQAFHDQLIKMGYSPAEENEESQICIVNTCTVTEGADSNSRHAIRQLAQNNPNARLLVTGCFAENKPEVVSRITGVTDVISNRDKEQLLSRVFQEQELPEFKIDHFHAHTRAFIKIQDGCNSFCTYCILPYVRGRSRSRTVPEIIEEIKTVISNGFKEIVLTGINVGDFDGGVAEESSQVRLAQLVKIVDVLPGLKRLRISSIDPDEVDDELSEAVLKGCNTSPSMHIVLQSGSNVILKRMNRKYTRQVFLETIDRLRAANPDFTFTTDIIVGFPGETEMDFLETLEIMRHVKFAKVHMFPYSDRDRTRASRMPNKVAQAVMRERKQIVLRLAEQLAFELRDSYVGRRMTVLTESLDPKYPGIISGHTDNFLPVWIEDGSLVANQLVEVDLVSNDAMGLCGRVVNRHI